MHIQRTILIGCLFAITALPLHAADVVSQRVSIFKWDDGIEQVIEEKQPDTMAQEDDDETAIPVTHKLISNEAFEDESVSVNIAAEVDETLLIKLSSNPTTGFRWVLAPTVAYPEDPSDGVVLVQDGVAAYKPSPVQKGMVGFGGIEYFVFEAKNAGRQELVFEYKRAWEKDIPPARTFSVNFTIKEPG